MVSLPVFAVAYAVAAAAAVAARPPPSLAVAEVAAFDSPAQALAAIVLSTKPVVLGFGEIHETTSGVALAEAAAKPTERRSAPRSTLGRFIDELLPQLGPELGALVVETWLSTGACGARERATTEQIARTIERPAATENEIVTLIKRAKGLGAVPRVLTVTCQDYERLFAGDAVDYDQLLRLTGASLGAQVTQAVGALSGADVRRLVAAYGGALHNDAAPARDIAPYGFAAAAAGASLGRYVEIDLVLPESLASDRPDPSRSQQRQSRQRQSRQRIVDTVLGPSVERRALARALALVRTGSTVVIRRSMRSYVLVFPLAKS